VTEAVYTLRITDDAEARSLSDELHALGAQNLEIIRRASSPQTRITGVAPEVLARALDHLCNAGKDSEEIRGKLERQLARLQIPPLTYRLRSWQFTWDEQDKNFWSYTP